MIASEGDPVARRRAERRHRRHAAIQRRRRLTLACAALAVTSLAAGAVVGAGGDHVPAEGEPMPAPELPRGGRSLLPEYRLIGYYGAPQSPELGALGIGKPSEATARLLEQAKAYRGERPVMPVLELIATVAASSPGDDGAHRLRQPHSVIERYLAEARRRHALLLLDVQPGRADFRDEIARLERYLREPDVGLALDPEWHVGPGEVPGQVIGSVEAGEVNAIAAELQAIVTRYRLPEKLFVIHQFTADMVEDRELVEPQPGLATVINVDGFGDPPNKIAKYRELRPPRGSELGVGFKLFYSEDADLMAPGEVLGLRPPPDLIVYE